MIIVCGPRRTNAGTNPLKNPNGPSRAVNFTTSHNPLNSPCFAFITLVFSTSSGCVNAVAIAPAINDDTKCVRGSSLKYFVWRRNTLTCKLKGVREPYVIWSSLEVGTMWSVWWTQKSYLIIECYLSNGHHKSSGRCRNSTGEKPCRSLFSTHPQQAIDSIFVAANGCQFWELKFQSFWSDPIAYFLLSSGASFTSFCIRTLTMSAGVPIMPPMKPDVPASNTLLAKPAFWSSDCLPTS